MNYKKISEYITNWMSKYIEDNSIKGFVIGVSGGIDSAVTSTLCAKTGFPLLILEMPIRQGKDQVTNAKKHIEFLKSNFDNVRSIEIDLTPTFEVMEKSFMDTDDFSDNDMNKVDLSLANLRSRLRMSTLYSFATMNDFIVCGTGNKIEDFGIFYFTKYGDGASDINPIGDLMKSEVYKLGEELGIIGEILNAVPTDGLWDNSKSDEEHIGASYDELEWAMNYLDMKTSEAELSDRQEEVLRIFKRMNKAGQHKVNEIPLCIIPHELKRKNEENGE